MGTAGSTGAVFDQEVVMPRPPRLLVLVALLGVVIGPTAATAAAPSLLPGMPREVISWRNASLPRAEYEALADAWRAYLAEHSGSAVAEVQLGRALRYAGAPADQVRAHFARALELDPRCPEALDAAASTYLGEWEPLADGAAGCYELGVQAVALAPDWPDPHFTLWPLALALGRSQEADDHLAALLQTGGIPAPVLDYCYNMLVGAEPDAIIFTNGDNDTFGSRALQVVHGIRPDIHIVNLSLISHPEIEATIFARFGDHSPLTERERRDMYSDFQKNFQRNRERYSAKVVKAMAAKAAAGVMPRPLYLALTVAEDHLSASQQARRLEGLLWRIVPAPTPAPAAEDLGTDWARTWTLVDRHFRLESATDLSFSWRRNSSIAALMYNYVAVLQRVAAAAGEQDNLEIMRAAFRRGLELASFHGHTGTVAAIAEYWRGLDPSWAEVESWLEPKD
jgi:hypothetical protein